MHDNYFKDLVLNAFEENLNEHMHPNESPMKGAGIPDF